MKNRGILIILAFLLILNIFIISVNAQLSDSGLPAGTEGDVQKIQNLSEKAAKTAEELTDEESREYLFQQWKEILLKKPVIVKIDSFLQKISIVFVILFGEPYSLSGILLIMIILWVYFLFTFSEILRDFSPFSEGIGWLIGIGLTIVMAQTKVLKNVTELLIWLIFYKKEWYFNLIIGIIIIGALFLIYYLSSSFGKVKKEQKKKEKEEIHQAKLKAGAKVAEELMRGAGEGI